MKKIDEERILTPEKYIQKNGGKKIVAQNLLKHILFDKFFKKKKGFLRDGAATMATLVNDLQAINN